MYIYVCVYIYIYIKEEGVLLLCTTEEGHYVLESFC